MSQIKFRHGRKFPPRITREELYKRTNQKVEECGVNNHFQAVFTDKIAQEVVGLKEYKYESLQPELRFRDNISWKSAFTVVQHYLKDFHMEITLNSMSTETQNQKLPTNEAILQKSNSVSFLGKLVDDSSNLPSFKDCVARFADEESLPETSHDKNSSQQNSAQRYTQKEQEKLFEPKNKKSAENTKPASPISPQKQQNNIDENLNNDDDFEDIQIEDENNLNESPIKSPEKTPPKPLASPEKPVKNDVVEEQFSDEFEDSFNEEGTIKTITQATFSKSDFSINVDELQSDDGKQEADKKQLLQSLMTEQEPKAELESPKKDMDQVQTQDRIEDLENNSDVELDIPLDDSNSDGFNSPQSQKQSQQSNNNDDFVEDDFVSDTAQKEASPSKQPQTNSVSNAQNSVTENVEDFDDIDLDLNDDFDQESEKEKKTEQEPSKEQPKITTTTVEDDFEDVGSDHFESAGDVDLENLPSSNNSPSKQPEAQKNDGSVHASDEFDDDFDMEIENNEDSPQKTSSTVSDAQKQTPVKPSGGDDNDIDEDIEVFADDFDNDNTKNAESDVVVDLDDDVQEENNAPGAENAKEDDIDGRFSEDDEFGDDFSDNFDIEGN